MKKKNFIALFAVLMMLLLAASPAANASDREDTRPVLAVEGTGEGTGTPDMATITIGVTTVDSDATAAQSENAARSTRIQKNIAALGIDEKDIQTRNYNFYPNYQNDETHHNTIVGYTVNNSVVVVVRDLSLVGKVIDSSLENGANEINSLDFTTKDTKKLRKEALTKAVRDARDKAEVIAKGLGKRIVGIKSVRESTGSVMPRRFYAAEMKLGDSNSTPIEAGSLSLSANVNIEFILSD